VNDPNPIFRTAFAGIGVNGSETQESLQDLANAALKPINNTGCHHCSGQGEMMKCGRCHVAYYCSPDCQKKAWRSHKLECKKWDEFLAGDKVILQNLVSMPKYNGHIVQVVGPAQTEGRIAVQMIGGDVRVKKENMKYVIVSPEIVICQPTRNYTYR
jgi:hypothetical protein